MPNQLMYPIQFASITKQQFTDNSKRDIILHIVQEAIDSKKTNYTNSTKINDFTFDQLIKMIATIDIHNSEDIKTYQLLLNVTDDPQARKEFREQIERIDYWNTNVYDKVIAVLSSQLKDT